MLWILASLLLATPSGALWPFTRRPQYPDPAQDLRGAAAAILSQAIRITTVNPPGEEATLARLLADILEREGIDARVIETPSGAEGGHRAAAWARVPGTGAARPIILLSHLDVVPAVAEHWLVEPFSGVVAGGYVVGRGALDAKSVAVVHLLALVELARREQRLSRDVILLATPDEESGGRLGAGYIAGERRDLLHDAEYLLTEGGSILDARGSDPNVWGITVSEKSPCWLRVVARGEPGHSSAASSDAAIPRLVGALERVRSLETEVRVVREVASMFEALAPLTAPEDRFAFQNLSFALEADPEFRGRFLATPGQNALVRNTLSITVLDAGSRTNVVPAEAFAHVDARLLPGDTCETFASELRLLIDDPRVEIEILLSFSSQSSRSDTALFEAIRSTAADVDPSALVVPRVIAGFNDAHYFRDLGIVAYGFVPRWLPPHETTGIHGPNERISIDNLERGIHTMVRILEALAGEQ